jgi:hypothetical protein
MAIRITLTGAALAVLATAGPLTGVAHAQGDLDCADFRFQEDAQAQFDLDRTDPNRLDEDQGRDDGIACEVLPHRGTAAVSAATPLPTLGVQGGVGGSTGPAGWERAVGVALALGGVGLAGTYVMRRRRSVRGVRAGLRGR